MSRQPGPGQEKKKYYHHQLSVFISRIAEVVCEVKKLMEKDSTRRPPLPQPAQHTLPTLKNADYVGHLGNERVQ